MVANIPFNPYVTTAGVGLFNTESKGLVQGQVYPAPNAVYNRAGGVLALAETLPMWGGCGIFCDIPGATGGPAIPLGATVGRATALTGSKALAGFSVFEGAYASVNTPQSPVPMVGSYGQVQYYRLGSGARIAVKCSPNLVNLQGDPIGSSVSWDFENQQLEPYVSTTISSGTYTDGTGAVSLTTAAPHGLLPGDTFNLDTLTGTGAFAALNGDHTATAGTTGSTIHFTAASGLGATTITGGNVASGGLLPVTVLEVQAGNCMTVDYDTNTGFATWDFDGNCAIILI